MSIRKSLAWLSFAQAVAAVVQLSSSIVLSRYLTPYEAGIYAVALAATGILAVFQQFGLNGLIVREEELSSEVSSTAFTVNALLAVMLSLAILAASFVGGAFLGDQKVRQVLLVLAVPPLLGILAFLPEATLERHGRFREIALISTAAGVINATATIALAVFGFSYMSVAYAQVISSILYSAIFVIVGRDHFSWKVSLVAWRRVTAFGLQSLAISSVLNVSQRISEIMLGRLLGLGALGLYNRASTLTGLFLNYIHSAANRVVLVDFAALYRQGKPLAPRYVQTVAIMTAVLWPTIAGLAVIAKPLIIVVYGPQWSPSVGPFLYLAMASVILTSITMTYEIFIVANELRAQTQIEVKRAIISLPIFVAACTISLEAAAAARVIDALIALLLYRPHLNRITGTTITDLRSVYACSALVALLAITPTALLMTFDGVVVPPLFPFVGAVAMGIALWAISLFSMGHPLANEVIAIVRNRLAVPQR